MYPIGDAPSYSAGGSATAVFSVLVIVLTEAIRLRHFKLDKNLAEKEVVDENGTVQNLHVDDTDSRGLAFRTSGICCNRERGRGMYVVVCKMNALLL